MSKKNDSRKTMFDFIIWYNDIDLKEVQKRTKVSYPTLIQLKKGGNHKFNYQTLYTIAKRLDLQMEDFYDWERQEHKYFSITPPTINSNETDK